MLNNNNKNYAIILELGENLRYLDTTKSIPQSLLPISYNSKQFCALDWSIDALKNSNFEKIFYAGNYHVEKIIAQHQSDLEIFTCLHKLAKNIVSIKKEQPQIDSVFIIPAHLVVTNSAISEILNEDNYLYYPQNSKNPIIKIEFDILINIFKILDNNIEKFYQLLIKGIQKSAPSSKIIYNYPNIAEVTNKDALRKLLFKGKAKTLNKLEKIIQSAVVLPQISINISDWQGNKTYQNKILELIKKEFKKELLIIRSSTTNEDNDISSGAGQFESILNVNPKSKKNILSAINKVITSYSKYNRKSNLNDQVLIQPQVTNLISTGVILTRNPTTNAPFFTLSYTQDNQDPEIITSGKAGKVINSNIYWQHDLKNLAPRVKSIIILAKELIQIFNNDSLDIEFGIDVENILYLFQVRPLVSNNKNIIADSEIYSCVTQASEYLAFLLENSITKTALGVMPDWNPAEMIGLKPKMLALSLYQELITNNSWSIARAQMGYKYIDSNLLINLLGTPYINIKNSLSSLIPKEISCKVADKLIDYGINVLQDTPSKHDKIEFYCAISYLSLDTKYIQNIFSKIKLNQQEITDYFYSLRDLTENIIISSKQIFTDLPDYYSEMQVLRNTINLDTDSDNILFLANSLDKILTNTIQNGIIIFAKLARMAFISMGFLRDLKKTNVLTQAQIDDFLAAIPSVTTEFTNDQILYSNNCLSIDELIAKYGHLRPSSYDITQENYAKNKDFYFNKQEKAQNILKKPSIDSTINKFSIKFNEIDNILQDLELNLSSYELFEFCYNSIKAREFCKFEFMKNIDYILNIINKIGGILNLSTEQLAHLHLHDLLQIKSFSIEKSFTNKLAKISSYNEKKWLIESKVKLPDLIFSKEDIEYFSNIDNEPNFVTQNSITAKYIILNKDTNANNIEDLTNKIIITESADPGYDWIFQHKIAGLITAYGGVASHMAIRCAELNIPSAIGTGLKLLDKFTSKINQKLDILLDCQNKKISLL